MSVDFFSLLLRQRESLPAEWQWYKLQCMPASRKTLYIAVTGPTYLRGRTAADKVGRRNGVYLEHFRCPVCNWWHIGKPKQGAHP